MALGVEKGQNFVIKCSALQIIGYNPIFIFWESFRNNNYYSSSQFYLQYDKEQNNL